jgi:hypothetical protein
MSLMPLVVRKEGRKIKKGRRGRKGGGGEKEFTK